MNVLEKRFYPRAEIAEIVGITNLKDKHFAEKVKRRLNNRMYKYAYSRKGITITDLPQTAEEKLTSLVQSIAGTNKQINGYDFACYVDTLSGFDGFNAMPWDSLAAHIKQEYNNDITVQRLRRWRDILMENGILYCYKKGALWKTVKDAFGDKIQSRVDPDSPEYQEYSSKRSALLTEYEKSGMGSKNIWPTMIYKLYPEYGVYYYCPEYVLNGLGENAEEISQLVAAVMAERREEEK